MMPCVIADVAICIPAEPATGPAIDSLFATGISSAKTAGMLKHAHNQPTHVVICLHGSLNPLQTQRCSLLDAIALPINPA